MGFSFSFAGRRRRHLHFILVLLIVDVHAANVLRSARPAHSLHFSSFIAF